MNIIQTNIRFSYSKWIVQMSVLMFTYLLFQTSRTTTLKISKDSSVFANKRCLQIHLSFSRWKTLVRLKNITCPELHFCKKIFKQKVVNYCSMNATASGPCHSLTKILTSTQQFLSISRAFWAKSIYTIFKRCVFWSKTDKKNFDQTNAESVWNGFNVLAAIQST